MNPITISDVLAFIFLIPLCGSIGYGIMGFLDLYVTKPNKYSYERCNCENCRKNLRGIELKYCTECVTQLRSGFAYGTAIFVCLSLILIFSYLNPILFIVSIAPAIILSYFLYKKCYDSATPKLNIYQRLNP